MNIRETLAALVLFLREGHQSGNTTAALHGVAHVDPAPGKDWERPRLVFLTEQDAHRMMREQKVPCMSLSDPHRLRTRRPGPVVFDTWTVEQLAEKALQRIQALERELDLAKSEASSRQRIAKAAEKEAAEAQRAVVVLVNWKRTILARIGCLLDTAANGRGSFEEHLLASPKALTEETTTTNETSKT